MSPARRSWIAALGTVAIAAALLGLVPGGVHVRLESPTCVEIQAQLSRLFTGEVRELKLTLAGHTDITWEAIASHDLGAGYRYCYLVAHYNELGPEGQPVLPEPGEQRFKTLFTRGLVLDFDAWRYTVHVDPESDTEGVIVVEQLGALYNQGRAEAGSVVPSGPSRIMYVRMQGGRRGRCDSPLRGTDKRGVRSYRIRAYWPSGRIPRPPIDGPGFPRKAVIAHFVGGVMQADMAEAASTWWGCGREAGGIGWLQYAGWSSDYPRLYIQNSTIGMWRVENTIGKVTGGKLNINGINVLIGATTGGSMPISPRCKTGHCGTVPGATAGGTQFVNFTTEAGEVSDLVLMGAATNLRFLSFRSENTGQEHPFAPYRLGDQIAVGAGYCSAGSAHPERNRGAGAPDVTDWPCTKDVQCGTGTCSLEGFSRVVTSGIWIDATVAGSTHDAYSALSLGPGFRQAISGGRPKIGPGLIFSGGFISTADRDDELGAPAGALAANLPALDGESGRCVGVIGEQCWIGDAATKVPGATCAGTGTRGSIEDVESWAMCVMVRGADGGARWIVGSGTSLGCRASSRDCQLFDWHPDADATIDIRLAQRAWFQRVSYPHALGILQAPRLLAPAP